MEAKIIPKGCDQFNSLHERLVEAFKNFDIGSKLHLTSSKGYDEDEATVRYLEECAIQAGLETNFIYLEDIGIDDAGALVILMMTIYSLCSSSTLGNGLLKMNSVQGLETRR